MVTLKNDSSTTFSPAALSLYMSSKFNLLEHKTTLYSSSNTTFPCFPRVFESFAFSCLAVSDNFLEYLYNASKNDFLALVLSPDLSSAKYVSLIIISGTRISITDFSCRVSSLLLYRCNFFISSNSIFFATIIAAASSLLPPPTITFLAPCLLNLMFEGGEFGFVIVPYSPSSSSKEFFIFSL